MMATTAVNILNRRQKLTDEDELEPLIVLAIQKFQKALKLDPKQTDTKLRLGFLLVERAVMHSLGSYRLCAFVRLLGLNIPDFQVTCNIICFAVLNLSSGRQFRPTQPKRDSSKQQLPSERYLAFVCCELKPNLFFYYIVSLGFLLLSDRRRTLPKGL